MTTEKILIRCAHCKEKFLKATRTIRKYQKQGRTDFYCSRECTKHGVNKKLRLKYNAVLEKRKCPVCKSVFEVKPRSKKKTCSYSCSNTYFRSGSNNGNWDDDNYTSTCFLFHKKKCVCCSEKNIVAVHHYDHDHSNNDPRNLVPLCPTHHSYVHSSFAYLVLPKIVEYVKAFRKKYKTLRA